MGDAMTAQVDAFGHEPLEPFRPWRGRDVPLSALSSMPSSSGRLVAPTRHRRPDVRLAVGRDVLRKGRPARRPLDPADAVDVVDVVDAAAHADCQAAGAVSVPPVAATTPPPAAEPRPSLKRRRSVTDVDGPSTATLSCKKRRLRRYLITSRLSQPFSQPASHILNRECVASGDKRFLKLAAITNARHIVPPSRGAAPPGRGRPPPAGPPAPLLVLPGPGEMLRRLALSNSLRRRVLAEVAGRKGGQPAAMPMPWTAMPAPQLPPLAASAAALFMSTPVYARMPGAGPAAQPREETASCGRELVETAASDTKDEVDEVEGVYEDLEGRDSRDSHDSDHKDDDDDSDGYYAFPGNQNESRYAASDDPDPEDVYSDFSLLFRASGDDDDDEGLDDYMDELDGIARGSR